MAVTDMIPWRRTRSGLPVRREADDWVSAFDREMTTLMDRFFRGMEVEPLGLGERLGAGEFIPRVDVSETEKLVKVTAELPGMDEHDIDVELSRDSLTIKGEKKEASEEKTKDYHHVERRYGAFQRVIPLPAEVDQSKVEAEFKKGLLSITLPKTPAAQQAHRKIPIKSQQAT